MSDVASRVLHSLDPALQRAGSSLDELLIDHALSPREIRGFPGGRIAWNTFADILEDAGRRLGGNPALEDVGANSLIWRWQTIIAVVSRYVSPFMAFNLGVKWFCPAIFRGICGHLEEIPGGLVETVVIPDDRRDSREFFALCLGAMRQFPTLIGWETTELDFSHSDHRGEYRMKFARMHARARRLPIQQHVDVGDDLEELSILQVDPDSWSTRSLPSSNHCAIADRTRTILRASPLGTALTASAAANRLAMSERSLARRLASEGTSFRALRDEVRCEIAIECMQRGIPISEVAYLLGFADGPSFHRAFRRWTGHSPGHYRRELESSLA